MTATVQEPVETVEQSAFSTQIPFLQVAWDSTSLGMLKSCPRLYKYSIIDGYTTPHGSAAELEFGIMLHSAKETYEKSRAKGNDHQKALIDAFRYAILASWDSEKGRPWTSTEPTRSRNTLLRTIVWYLDKFSDDTLETIILDNGKAAVELSFRFSLNDLVEDGSFRASTGEEYMLCGALDRAALWNGEAWIVDVKSTKYDLDDNYFRQFNPDNQISLYAIAGQISLPHQKIGGLLIDGIQILVSGSRFRRREIPRSPEQLEEWLLDLRFWLHQAETYATEDHWPMNEKSCGYGKRQCRFRQVCSADPSMRQEILDNYYIKRPWNPLRTR